MSESTPLSVLMVDDEPLVLAGYRRTIGRIFNLTIAEGGAAGLDAIAAAASPFAVVITDMRMPAMNGIEFITAARARSRDSVYMMLTGNADQQTAVHAINHGHIFRFLNKPCPADTLEAAVRAAMRQFELATVERVLLRDTFTGSIKFMTEALELANPELFKMQSVVRQIVQGSCAAVGVRFDWHLYVASSLNLIGLITIPGLPAEAALPEKTLLEAAATGSRLLSHIPRIGVVVDMIRRQREVTLPPSTNLTALGTDDQATFGAHLLRFAVDLAQEQRRAADSRLGAMRMAKTGRYDTRLTAAAIDAATAPLQGDEASQSMLQVCDLRPGMILAEDVRKQDGSLLLSAGHALSELALASLRNLAMDRLVGNTVRVRASAPTAGVTEHSTSLAS